MRWWLVVPAVAVAVFLSQCGSSGQSGEDTAEDLTIDGTCSDSNLCADRECGSDGCGGSCGECSDTLVCNDQGQCVSCDPIANSLCPDEEYCTYLAEADGGTTGPLCLEAGKQSYADPCGGLDSCKEGICMEIVGTGIGQRCYPLCLSKSDCDAGLQCLDFDDVPYRVCALGTSPYETCNLLDQNCEVEGYACYYDTNAAEAVCLPAGSKASGESCSGTPNDCQAGSTCLSNSTQFVCRSFCSTKPGGEPSCDPDGPTPKCTNYYSAQSAGYCID